MTKFSDYQEQSERTMRLISVDCTDEVARKTHRNLFLAYAGLGLAGEAGEVVEILKKVTYHDHPLDSESQLNIKKELGDVLWYIAYICSILGIDMADVATANIEKLKLRYPDGFSSEASINRKV